MKLGLFTRLEVVFAHSVTRASLIFTSTMDVSIREVTYARQKQTFCAFEAKFVVVAEMLQAVHANHKIGIVHRDVKPDKIMLSCDLLSAIDGQSHAVAQSLRRFCQTRHTELCLLGYHVGLVECCLMMFL